MREYAYSNKKVATAFAAIALVLPVGFFVLPVQKAHAADPPTQQEILDALALGNEWFDDNIKWQTEETEATTQSIMAEYQSLPFAFRDDDGDYIRVGEDVQVGAGIYTTKVYDFVEGPAQDTYSYRIQVCVDTGSFGNYVCDAPRIKVTVDHDFPSNSGQARISVLHEEWINNGKTVDQDVRFGQSVRFTLSAATEGQTFNIDITQNGDSSHEYKSHRYTERHATQIAAMWADVLDDATLQDEFEATLTARGYTLEKDIYAPVFDQGTQFGYEFMYESGSNGVYRDCYVEPAMDIWAYQYHSKVCLNVDGYITLSKTSDILVPMLWAIHLLNKGHGIDTDRNDGYRTWSPRDVAREAENWWIADYGIKSPSAPTKASGVRTAVFLVLETLMAERGDTTSDDYRDLAAEALMEPRVREDGIVSRENEDGSLSALYRPQHVGTWYTAWNGFDYVAKKSDLQQITDLFNQIDEHPDVKPTNAETNILIMQALHTYDCHVYSGDCENVVE